MLSFFLVRPKMKYTKRHQKVDSQKKDDKVNNFQPIFMKPTLFERKIIHACIQSDKYKIKRYFRLKKERKRTLGCKSKVTRKQAGLVVCVTAIFVEKKPYDFE